MKKSLTKIISTYTIPLIIAGGIYLSKPTYTYASQCGNGQCEQGENALSCPQDCGNSLIKGLDALSKTKPGQIINEGRKKVEDWAVKQGTGKTLTELENEANQAIKDMNKTFTDDTKKSEYSNSTYNTNSTPKQGTITKEEPKTEEELIKEQARQRIIRIQDKAKRLTGNIDKDKIILLFEDKLNDDKTPYNIDNIEWKLGSFTAKGEQEAIVKFYDRSQCHASAASEVWLLNYKRDIWNVDRKLSENDSVKFETIDIQKDGKLEVLLSDSGGNQGYFITGTQLISIDGETAKVLYSNEGWDNFSAGKEGEAVRSYEVKFSDIDKDGLMEIIETEKTDTYSYNGKTQDFKNYKKTSTKTIETTYKLQGDKYIKIKSLEKLSDIEKIVKQLNLVYNTCKEYATDTSRSCKKAYDTIIGFFKDLFTGKEYIEYSAKKGDTLSIISKNKTGDWKNWKQILEYNKKHNYKTFDENINIGEKVYIPKHMLKK